ncbi:MAG TPA: polysaccharide pyruvyl transferase family protein [Mycobacterium sp.]
MAPGGHPNYGDEFILRAWLNHLARVRPDAQVVVDCHTPGQAAVLLAGCHRHVTFVDTIWRICFATAHLEPAEAIATAARVVGDPGQMPKLVSGIEMLAAAQTVHLIGGGYINMVWPHHLALLAAATAAAQCSRGRAVATGQGLMPVGVPEREALLRELQVQFALFDVRDTPSARAVAGAGGDVSCTGDDAWLGIRDRDVYDTESAAAQRPFGFCLQSDLMDDFADGRGTDGLTEAVAALVDTWGIGGDEVVVVEAIPGADRLVYDRIAHRLPGAIFVPFTELWRRGLPARPGQTWISTRFHVHLLAAAAGASGLAPPGRIDYYPVKHQSLIDAGSHWQILDSTNPPAAPTRSGGFDPDTVNRLHQGKAALADRIYPPPSWRRRGLTTLRSVTAR